MMRLKDIINESNTRCVEGRLLRHDPQPDDPELMTDRGECPDCEGKGCPERDEIPECVWRHADTPFAENH